MKTAIYIRVSTEEQAKEGYSLEAQKYKLSSYCAAMGLEIAGIYIEEGISASKLKDRVEAQRLLEDIRKGELGIENVLVWKLDRFFRNVKELLDTIDFLKEHNVRLSSMEENIDITTPVGKMVVTFLGSIAELELSTITARMMSGKEQKLRQGKFLNHPFTHYAYKYDKESDILKLIPEHANVVLEVIDKIKNGWSVRACAIDLTKRGIPSPSGGNFWYRESLNRIIRNPILKGHVGFKGQIFPVTNVETLLAEEEFDNLIDLLNSRHQHSKKIVNDDYTFVGVLRCECGGRMYAKQIPYRYRDANLNFKYYRCENSHSNRPIKCTRPMIRIEDMDKLFLDYIVQLQIPEPKTVDKKETSHDKTLALLQKEETSLKRQKKNLQLYYLDGKFGENEYRDLMKEINLRFDEVEQKIVEETKKRQSIEYNVSQNKEIELLKKIVTQIKQTWSALPKQERRNFVLKHIKEINIKGDNIAVVQFK